MADILAEKTLAQAKFALDIRNRMRKEHEYDLSGQFFRATSSVGANLAEAHSPHSVQSFLAKTLIARQK